MGKRKREVARARREERERAAESARLKMRARRRLWSVAIAAVVVIIVVAVLIAVSTQGSKAPSKAADMQGVSQAQKLLKGIPQNGLVLGKSAAPITVLEYADLQCPICQAFVANEEPQLISDLVRPGKAKIEYKPFPVLGADSEYAADALLAAAAQNMGWQYLEVFYANQGEENTGYVTNTFVTNVAKAAGLNVAKFTTARQAHSDQYDDVWRGVKQEATELGFNGTPSFALKVGNGEPQPLPNAHDAASIEQAVAAAQ